MNRHPFFRIEFSLHILVLSTWMVRKLGMGVAGVGTHAALFGHNSELICLTIPDSSYRLT